MQIHCSSIHLQLKLFLLLIVQMLLRLILVSYLNILLHRILQDRRLMLLKVTLKYLIMFHKIIVRLIIVY